MKLFAPFVVEKLHSSGASRNVLEAQQEVIGHSPAAYRALAKVMENHPVLLKRDPALHKYSIQGFKPRLTDGSAIKIHPLVTSGYNADFDGDAMSVFVPIGEDAKAEAVKMMPSNNLFSEASGKVMYQPTLESALGLYKLSRVNKDKAAKKFGHPAQVIEAARGGKVHINDPVMLDGRKTTAGRILMATALPAPMQKGMLHDMDLKLDKKGLDQLLTEVARHHDGSYGEVANKLKDIGNGASFGIVPVEHSGYKGPDRFDPSKAITVAIGTHTLGLDDFTPDKISRDTALRNIQPEVDRIKRSTLGKAEKDRQLINQYKKADRQMQDLHMAAHRNNPNNLLTMREAGVKPSANQYKQMVMAPMLVEDASGRIVPTPITKSYAEGLDTGSYWTQMHGARRGAVLKVQQVREPGYLSKLMMANTMDLLVDGDDCGTKKGISLPVTDSEVHDRYLQKDFHAKGLHVPTGTLLTPDVVGKMRAADKNAKILVRSPLKCESPKGICQKDLGLAATGQPHEIGENVGVSSAQTLGERAVQLTLRVFHTGGAVDSSGGSNVIGGFDRFNQLMRLSRKIPNSSALANKSGTIDKIDNDPTGVNIWIGGRKHHVGKDKDGAPLNEALPSISKDPGATPWAPPKVGMKVERGQLLSDPNRTVINPHDLYKATGNMESVQNYLADQIHELYKGEGVKRAHIETVVKAMSNLTKVKDPGDYEGLLRGEFHPHSRVVAINRELVKGGKKPIEHEPVLKGVDMLPLSMHDDWMAKLQHQRLEGTILDAAAEFGKSNLHDTHPIPGIAYGAEFGMGADDARKKPSLKHLSNVPKVSY